jgi:hypothetical protein
MNSLRSIPFGHMSAANLDNRAAKGLTLEGRALAEGAHGVRLLLLPSPRSRSGWR